jgi:hypothetical protein
MAIATSILAINILTNLGADGELQRLQEKISVSLDLPLKLIVKTPQLLWML